MRPFVFNMLRTLLKSIIRLLPLFSTACALFAKNTRGVGYPAFPISIELSPAFSINRPESYVYTRQPRPAARYLGTGFKYRAKCNPRPIDPRTRRAQDRKCNREFGKAGGDRHGYYLFAPVRRTAACERSCSVGSARLSFRLRPSNTPTPERPEPPPAAHSFWLLDPLTADPFRTG